MGNRLLSRSRRPLGFLGRYFLPLTGIALLVVVWAAVCGLGVWSRHLLPSPADTLAALAELWSQGSVFLHVWSSLCRFAAGYLLAVSLAVPLGLFLGWNRAAMRMFNPLLQVLRPISPMAWFPFIVLWFGIGNAPAVAIITIAAFFPVLLATASAMRQIDPVYLRVSQNFCLGRWQFFLQIAIPSVFPHIMVGLRMAVGTAWIFLVAGEMVGAQEGLGYLIIDARNNMRTDVVLAGIVIIGLIGWAIDALVSLAEASLARRWGVARAGR